MLHVCRNGLKTSQKKESDIPVNRNCVDICKKFFLKNGIRKRKTINKKYGSYTLKHIIESSMGEYVANGDLIQAAHELGFEVERTHFNSPNAYFNASYVTIKNVQQTKF